MSFCNQGIYYLICTSLSIFRNQQKEVKKKVGEYEMNWSLEWMNEWSQYVIKWVNFIQNVSIILWYMMYIDMQTSNSPGQWLMYVCIKVDLTQQHVSEIEIIWKKLLNFNERQFSILLASFFFLKKKNSKHRIKWSGLWLILFLWGQAVHDMIYIRIRLSPDFSMDFFFKRKLLSMYMEFFY